MNLFIDLVEQNLNHKISIWVELWILNIGISNDFIKDPKTLFTMKENI